MDVVEFITFIAAMLLLLVSRRNKRQREDPEEVEAEDQEQAARLREFLQTVNHDMKDIPPPKMPSALPQVTQGLRKSQKAKPVKSNIHPQNKLPAAHFSAVKASMDEEKAFDLKVKDAYAYVKPKNNRAHNLIHQLKNPQEMVLLHEIIGPPKALKQEAPYGEFPR